MISAYPNSATPLENSGYLTITGDRLLPLRYSDAELYLECRLTSIYSMPQTLTPKDASNAMMAYLGHLQVVLQFLAPTALSIGMMFVAVNASQPNWELSTEKADTQDFDATTAQMPTLTTSAPVSTQVPRQVGLIHHSRAQVVPIPPKSIAPLPPASLTINGHPAPSESAPSATTQ
jgi:hypothetical protein